VSDNLIKNEVVYDYIIYIIYYILAYIQQNRDVSLSHFEIRKKCLPISYSKQF